MMRRMSKRKKRTLESMTRVQTRLWDRWRHHIHKQVKALRSDLGITHRELGQHLGVSHGTSIRWCSGKTIPDMPVLLDMMRRYQLPASYFFEI